ncbi:protein-disulfide reductase DsbD [Avibacterium sp. 20-15]|uniref:protein-disulfide reductase DsbD n=1 Tax=unclassified Avibacterium TaxID=2685287 RepID=UPI002026320B|nr:MULTISPECIES: protein-disulfide reductase DsbD [unclassified Avibacterium]MCW9733569.1 protein-disulfide reductase DsbD [Avibacterium sp. 20-15]URL03426.1 protein-disulfide reductase DsbD [Avibacterium sp. 20-132]
MKKIFTFLFCFCTALVAQAGLFDSKPRFFHADEAFQFSTQSNGENLQLIWQIAPDYYLYKKEISVEQAEQKVAHLPFPPAEKYQDEFFGETEIYRNHLALTVPISSTTPHTVSVTYQGCTKGFCYPPETKIVQWQPSSLDLVEKSSPKNTALMPALNEQQSLAQRLFESKYAVFGFFLLGVGLAFTPCVLPMLPLLSAVVIGSGQRPSTVRALGLSLAYIQGMALTYTLLGLAVAAIGLPFQIALQSPYVLIGLSLIFILLALSMFGVFTLQLPSSLQTKLTLLSQKQKGGAFGGVFVMGMIAGLVASPCTSAPLSGALLYVAQSGDLFTGAITLYLLALGMGVPLILATVFGNRILPKSGDWLEKVKVIFGFVMLALPVFLLSRILPEIWENRLWALLGVSFCLWAGLQIKARGIGWVLRIGFFILAMMLVKPLQGWLWAESNLVQVTNAHQNTFQKVSTYEELQKILQKNDRTFAMLDLYADWCVACKEFEKYTFSDPKVQQAFDNILLLQVDMTKNSNENKALMEKLNVLGLPTLIFFDQQGNEIESARITGFMNGDTFFHWLKERLK